MTLSPDEREALLRTLVRRARDDVGVFNSLCFKDKKSGNPWVTTGFQRDWHNLVDKYDRLVLLAPAGHGKSEQITRSWVLRRIGQHPNETGAIVSNVAQQAVDRMKFVAQDIRTNRTYQAVFPEARMEKRSDYWQMDNDHGFIVERPLASHDPTVQAVGVGGPLLGARLDWAVVDDPCDFDNTSTAAQRKKALAWILSTLVSRFDGKGKIVVIMTSWHEEDIGHALANEYGFHLERYEACDEAYGNILWSERYPEEVLRKIELGLGPTEFARTMRNRIRSDTFNRIQYDLIRHGLTRGCGFPVGVRPPGCSYVITGCDPASGKKQKAGRGDLSALFTFAGFENGDRQVLEVASGRWRLPELVDRIKARWQLYQSLMAVEDNGVQSWLAQQLEDTTAIPVVPMTTGSSKWDPATGVESISIELSAGKWIIPTLADGRTPATPEIAAWVQEMQEFTLGAHTGDRLMACYIGRRVATEHEARQLPALGDMMLGSAALTQGEHWRI